MHSALRSVLLMAVFCFFTACQFSRSTATGLPTEELVAAGQPEILFLQLKVSKKGDGYSAEVVKQQQVAGLLNQDLRGVHPSEGQWLVSLLDEKKKMIAQVAVDNPLDRHYETTDEQGKLRDIEVKKDEANCFVRVQYDPRFFQVQIEQVSAHQAFTKIISIKI